MTFSNEDPREQLHVRLNHAFKERVESFANAHNISQSELARTALDEYLPNDETIAGPTDPTLRETYRWLHERADDRRELPAKLAMTALAQELGIRKEFVQRTRLIPLQRKGWIEPEFGTITVIPPEERNSD